MIQLIDKSALVAEIERRINFNEKLNAHSRLDECNAILSFLDTLEVKEVDLEKKIKDYFDSQPIIARSKGTYYKLIPTSVDIAKHFYELGLKAQKGE